MVLSGAGDTALMRGETALSGKENEPPVVLLSGEGGALPRLVRGVELRAISFCTRKSTMTIRSFCTPKSTIRSLGPSESAPRDVTVLSGKKNEPPVVLFSGEGGALPWLVRGVELRAISFCTRESTMHSLKASESAPRAASDARPPCLRVLFCRTSWSTRVSYSSSVSFTSGPPFDLFATFSCLRVSSRANTDRRRGLRPTIFLPCSSLSNE